jgi:hypothetical protein
MSNYKQKVATIAEFGSSYACPNPKKCRDSWHFDCALEASGVSVEDFYKEAYKPLEAGADYTVVHASEILSKLEQLGRKGFCVRARTSKRRNRDEQTVKNQR